jgi:hypothetical protein
MTAILDLQAQPHNSMPYARIDVIMDLYCRSLGARGGVVVKALRYKPEGHRFDFRLCHWNFSVT